MVEAPSIRQLSWTVAIWLLILSAFASVRFAAPVSMANMSMSQPMLISAVSDMGHDNLSNWSHGGVTVASESSKNVVGQTQIPTMPCCDTFTQIGCPQNQVCCVITSDGGGLMLRVIASTVCELSSTDLTIPAPVPKQPPRF